MSSSGGKRNYHNDDATAFDRGGVVMPDPRIFGVAHAAALERLAHAAAADRNGVVTADPRFFGLGHATAADARGAVVIPDPRVFGLGRATAADGHGVVMPYRGNFRPGDAATVTHDPGDFELGPATAPPAVRWDEGGGAEGERGGEPDGKKSFKNFPWYVTIWGWALLVIQGLVMVVLFQGGGGRVAFIEVEVDNSTSPAVILWDDAECLTARGPPLLVSVVFFRAVAAVVAQLITFCASGIGLLKPFEATWVVVGYVMHFIGSGMAWCCGIIATLPTYEVTTTYSNGSRSTHQSTPWLCTCLFIVLFWVVIPAFYVWGFTFRLAAFNLMAVCDLVLDNGAIPLFLGGSFLLVIVGIVVMSYCNSSWKTGSIVPFARAFLVLDSLTTGVTAVWGNYVQSGVVAGTFALLPLFNCILTVLELSK